MATYTVKSPDYPTSKPAYQSTEWRRKRGYRPDVRYEAFTVALICACAGVREEVYEDDVLIWQSLNCKPATSLVGGAG